MASRYSLPTLLLCCLSACGDRDQDRKVLLADAAREENEATLVVVAPLVEGRVESNVERTGEIETLFHVPLFPDAAGRVDSVLADVGDRVENGQALVILNDEQARLLERVAKAALDEVKESVTQKLIALEEARDRQKTTTTRTEQASREHQRTADLFAERLVTQLELEEKKLALDDRQAEQRAAEFGTRKAQAELDQANNSVASSQIQYERAQFDVRQLTLKAPFAGVISERRVHRGAVVSQATQMLTLVDDQNLVIRLKVTQQDITRVRVDQHVEIRAREAFPGRTFQGRVDRLSPVVELGSGSRIARVQVLDGLGELRPGLFVQCRVLTKVDEQSLLVPRRAVFYQDQKPSFFTIVDGTARRVVFLPGPGTKDCFQVIQHQGPPIQAGSMVVIVGKDQLDEGKAVRTATHSDIAGDGAPKDANLNTESEG